MQTVRFLFESKPLPFPGLPWGFTRSTMHSPHHPPRVTLHQSQAPASRLQGSQCPPGTRACHVRPHWLSHAPVSALLHTPPLQRTLPRPNLSSVRVLEAKLRSPWHPQAHIFSWGCSWLTFVKNVCVCVSLGYCLYQLFLC